MPGQALDEHAHPFNYDIIIIGAGSAGLSAAKFAAQFGARTALIEGGRVGGDCTWTGCVPSKSLLKCAKTAHMVRNAGRFGCVVDGDVRVDMRAVKEYVAGRVSHIYQEDDHPDLLSKRGIEIFTETHATFVDPHTVRLTQANQRGEDGSTGGTAVPKSITARSYILCTGAKATPNPTPLRRFAVCYPRRRVFEPPR